MTHSEATRIARQSSCLVCGDVPCEPCHYPTHRGMGGAKAGWEPTEWVALCRRHHDCLDGRNGVSASCREDSYVTKVLIDERLWQWKRRWAS